MKSNSCTWIGLLIAAVICITCSSLIAAPTAGPLRVHPDNPRYFTDGAKTSDGSLRVVYLTGSHHWNNLQDVQRGDKPISVFDYAAYLQLMRGHGHNLMRLWAWEGGANRNRYDPLPYAKTESGKYDLDQFNEAYFERLRLRVKAARDEGIFVSVMLFQGWSIYDHSHGNPWPIHPFNAANNINGVDGDADKDGKGKELHSLQIPAVTRLQEAYVRKVVETVNDLDNVLYEVTNETADYSKAWQYHVIRYVKEYEANKPKQHPVGMTYFDSGPEGTMDALLQSPADWISPGDDGGRFDYRFNPPAAEGRKVSIADTDHIYGTGGDAAWVWKTFMRGHNPIYMDPLVWAKGVPVTEADLEGARRAMGQTRRFAERMNLARVSPHSDLASTKYCLAAPGAEYLVYLPDGGSVTLDLSAAKGELSVEWFDTENAKTVAGKAASGGARRELKAPFGGHAVLYVRGAAVQ